MVTGHSFTTTSSAAVRSAATGSGVQVTRSGCRCHFAATANVDVVGCCWQPTVGLHLGSLVVVVLVFGRQDHMARTRDLFVQVRQLFLAPQALEREDGLLYSPILILGNQVVHRPDDSVVSVVPIVDLLRGWKILRRP